MPEVRCADCGLLTLRLLHQGQYLEADTDFRSAGERHGILEETTGAPICMVRAFDLRDEARGWEGLMPDAARDHTVITKPRPCPRFVAWVQGLSPKEHVEMHHAERMEQIAEERKKADEERAEERRRADQKRQDELRTEQRAWQEAQDRTRREREDARDKESRAWQERQNNINRVVQVTLFALTILAGAIGWAIGRYANNPQPQPIIQAPADPKGEPK